MNNSTVSYSFNEFGLTVDLVVNTTLRNFEATDNNTYPGYAIIGGTGRYVVNGQQFKFHVAPQSINMYNVLWAAPPDGNGGSSNGLDTSCIAILRDNAFLAWNQDKDYWINLDKINGAVTLQSVNGWPIR